MRVLTAIGRFWYDFLVGDDPKILIAVLLALGVTTAVAVAWAAAAPVVGALAIAAAFTAAVLVDSRQS